MSELQIQEPTKVDINPYVTMIQKPVTNKNKNVLANLNKVFASIKDASKAPAPTKENDFWKRTSLTKRIELDSGDQFTIDVQPDQRFPTAYMMYCTVHEFPDFNIKSHAAVSPFSLIAYSQVLFNAYLLYNDIHIRNVTSADALLFQNDAEHSDYFTLILDSEMPTTLAYLIESFASVLDPSRELLEYIPTLAAARFAQDYGRLCPPQIMLNAHNALSTTRANTPVAEILRQWYDRLIITVNNRTYHITHFLGGYYRNGAQGAVNQHYNWLNQLFETVFNPAVGRALLQRPTFASLNITPQLVEHQNPNYYEFMLNAFPEDIPTMRHLVSSVSAFYDSETTSSVPMRSVLEKVSGITTLIHTIEPFTLPTWHHDLTPTTAAIDASPTVVTHQDYAARNNILSPAPIYNNTIPYPACAANAWRPDLYLVNNAPYDPAAAHYEYDTFHLKKHLTPDVLLQTPFGRDANRATQALVLGLKIEAEEFDGSIIPLENPRISLSENNSHYLQGTIPESKIKPVIISTNDRHRIRIVMRTEHDSPPLGICLRDMSINALPRFANDAVQANTTAPPAPFTIEHNHNTPAYAWTATAWNHAEECLIPHRSRHLWSSYRHCDQPNLIDHNVDFYYSLRPLFGLGIPVSRIPHPSKLIVLP